MQSGRSQETLQCSFCHKSQDKVARLIGTPKRFPSAYICDKCVAECNSIFAQHGGPLPRKKSWFHRVKSWWSCGMIENIIFKH